MCATISGFYGLLKIPHHVKIPHHLKIPRCFEHDCQENLVFPGGSVWKDATQVQEAFQRQNWARAMLLLCVKSLCRKV